MTPRRLVQDGIDRGLRLGRGTADGLLRLAGPRVVGVVGELTARLRRNPADLPTTETFAPSRPHDETPRPTPAAVARNIAPRRPAPEPVRAPSPPRRTAPGAKLPPRPRTT